jgi:hypothetical protein
MIWHGMTLMHSPYSLDLVSSYYHLSRLLKGAAGVTRKFFADGIKKVVRSWKRCIDSRETPENNMITNIASLYLLLLINYLNFVIHSHIFRNIHSTHKNHVAPSLLHHRS